MPRPPVVTPAGPCLLWSGLLVGGSVAAVSKFSARDVPRDALLRVGRAQFAALRRVEAVVAAAALAAAAAAPGPASAPVGVAVAAAALQAGVLVPWMRRDAAERERAGRERAERGDGKGGAPGTLSRAHALQVAVELLKLGAVMYAASVAL